MQLLVAYASRRGPTKAIAERLARGLQLSGLDADACPTSDPIDIASYDGVVLGSTIRGGQWLPGGARFAVENSHLLRQRLTWLFSLGVDAVHPDLFRSHTAKRLRVLHRETEQIDALRHLTDPLEHRYFSNRPRRRGDWTPVDAWARSIASDVEFWTAQALQTQP
jgi:menaquinone-dependent protoporphyrinogen IX oxidase